MKKKCLYKNHYAYYAYNDDTSEWTGHDKYDEEFRCKYKKHVTHAPTKHFMLNFHY